MKVIAESAWEQVKFDLVKDPDARAKRMLDFVVNWANAAEEMLALYDNDGNHLVTMPMEALRRTLSEAEVKTGTVIPTMELGQALLILGSVWEPAATDREAFAATMGSIELKLYAEMGQIWAAHRQAQAQQQEVVQ